MLVGSETMHASEYPPGLCDEVSDVIAKDRELADDTLLFDLEAEADSRAGALGRIYFNEILESAPWDVVMRTACGARQEHINILEVRACLRIMRQEAERLFGKRQIYGLDPQVGTGALIKGRSPSRAINEELRSGLPDIVGVRSCPGFYFAPTRLNPADCLIREMCRSPVLCRRI